MLGSQPRLLLVAAWTWTDRPMEGKSVSNANAPPSPNEATRAGVCEQSEQDPGTALNGGRPNNLHKQRGVPAVQPAPAQGPVHSPGTAIRK